MHIGMRCCMNDGPHNFPSLILNYNFSDYEIYRRIKRSNFPICIAFICVDLFVSKLCLELKFFLICKCG